MEWCGRSLRQTRLGNSLGVLPVQMPGELALGLLARARVRSAERGLDAVVALGRPLGIEARQSAAHAGTLLMVSGFGGSTRGLGPMLRSAERDGINAVGVAIPGGGLDSVHAGVRALDDAIAQVPTGPLHLAGHSKGGIVIQEWWRTAAPQQRARVESMTLISSSSTGQKLGRMQRLQMAALWPVTGPLTSSIMEASARNPVMQRIGKLNIPRSVRSMSIISTGDKLMSVDEATWKGARMMVLDGPQSHMETLIAADAYAALRDNVLGRT